MGVGIPARTAASDPPAGDSGGPRWWRRRPNWAAVVALLLLGLAIGLVSHLLLRPPREVPDIEVRQPEIDRAYTAAVGMGWQDMDRADPTFDQAVEYVRPSEGWAGLNPAPGEYDWSLIDDAIDEAQGRGHLLSFRIYTMRHPEWDGHKVPQWVLDDGAELLDGGEPDYSNAVYQEHWATFVNALRERYDGDERIAFIDVSGYGNYNEWSWEDQTEWDQGWQPGEAPSTLDGQARQRLADVFLGGSGTIEARDEDGDVITVDYDYPGFQDTQLIMPYAGIRQSLWYALDKRDDVGWRYDCLGQIGAEDLYGLRDDALSRWREAPMVYEFCSDVDWSTVDEAVGLTHPVLVHDNSTDDRDRIADLLGTVGYHFALDSADAPGTIEPGGTARIATWWRNIGTSPAYPSLGADLELQVALRTRDGRAVAQATAPTDVSGWQPGASIEAPVDLAVPDGVAPGTYELAVAVVDRGSGDPVALALRDVGDDGWFPLGRVRVEADG